MVTVTLSKQDILNYLQAVKRRIDDEAAMRIDAMPAGRRYDRAVDAIEQRATRDIQTIEAVETLIRTYGPDEHVADVRERSQEGLVPPAGLVHDNGW